MPVSEQPRTCRHPLDSPKPHGADEDEATLDVRTRRTRARLREAVLRLASERPVEEISVAELVRAARINRTTFYKHAESPVTLLEQVLYADLDRIRTAWLADIAAAELSAREVWERASGALVAHLEDRDALYTAGLAGRRSASLNRLLVDHFTASVRALLDQDPRRVPDGEGTASWRAEAHSRFLAHGEAGLVEAWLSLPRPRDPRLFVSAAKSALAPWLDGPSHADTPAH
ncbi:TetR/AcrR family transcriptional regulator [Streptomyces sp. NPDC052052]|uniref:TetR/AcrR family transcriptional regulator n=1 Tax=Streptomyces sp. NPDC052052 TaxID=3154756 RepID=UPI00343C2009